MSEQLDASTQGASRRTVVRGFVGVGVGVPLLAACGSDDSADTKTESKSEDSGGTTSSGAIGKAADVPVGGGKIYEAEKVVVTQPTAGEFKAFSSTCTHKGCQIKKLEGTDIVCDCHGSRFSMADGSAIKAPDGMPLEQLKALQELKVTVSGEDLSVT